MRISPTDLERAIEGDLTVMRRPSEATHSQLEAASAKPFVRAVTVGWVVESLINGESDPSEVQIWASLLMHGYGPVRPIDIPHEPEFEEEIVEVIFVLEQLGDLVDGEVDSPKLRALIAPLKTVTGS